ncbi:hypothetical protein [Sphingomonas profundi]|uniref:hypothetical protein n=1 Tax=Alterirhizorhabdus profundi TaxID=2681549 RepID=UPI0012E8B8D0|nr:hypothetical protein [Sphingomonas profundi]
MSALGLSDSLAHGPCVAFALAARERYRTVLGFVLIVEAAAGVALLLFPHSVARLVLDAPPGPAGFTRLAGLLLLILCGLFAAARAFPERAKIANVVGVVGRGAVAVLLLAGGGRLIAAGLAEAAAAAALGLFYYRYFTAEVMSRP